jgi:hypothetical protein
MSQESISDKKDLIQIVDQKSSKKTNQLKRYLSKDYLNKSKEKENRYTKEQKQKNNIEKHIFGDVDFKRLQTLQNKSGRNSQAMVSYPKLRESANHSKFQNNLRPRSHSKLSNSRSVRNHSSLSRSRFVDRSLQRCMTNLDLVRDSVESNYMPVGNNSSIMQ